MAQYDLIRHARHWLQDLSESTIVQDADYKWKTWQLVDYANWAINEACLRSRLIFDDSDTDGLTRYDIAESENVVQLHPSVLFITEVRLWYEDPQNPGQYLPVQWKLMKRSAGYLNSQRFNWELTQARPYEWMQYDGNRFFLGHLTNAAYRLRIKCYRYPRVPFTVLAQPWAATTQQYVGDYRTHTTGSTTYQVRCVQAGTTAASEPTWDIGAEGNETTDGSVVWEHVGEYAPLPELRREYWNDLRFGIAEQAYGMQDAEVQSARRAADNAERFARRFGLPVSAETIRVWQEQAINSNVRYPTTIDERSGRSFIEVV